MLNDRAVELSTAKVHDYSDSVPCRSRIHENPRSIEAWKEKIEWFTMSPEVSENWMVLSENQSSFEWKIQQE